MDYLTLTILVALGIVTPCIGGFLVLFYVYPNYMVKLLMMLRERSVGMKVKFIGDENFVFCYGEKNKPQLDRPSVVFVHGFTSSKDQWLSCFKHLPPNIHMVAPDLPGHGGSMTPGPEVKPDLDYILERMNTFLDMVGFADRKVHMIGSSLGGAVAGIFAAYHPERVEKVTIVCPAMETPVKSEFIAQVKESVALGPERLTHDNCLLLPQDLEGTKRMFEMCTYNNVTDKVSDQIWKGFLLLRLNRNEFFLRLYKTLANFDYLNILLSLAPEIKMPTQLVWGQDDAVIHISGLEVLKSKLPNCRHVDVIEKCGHAIDIDRPGAFVKVLKKFIMEDIDAE